MPDRRLILEIAKDENKSSRSPLDKLEQVSKISTPVMIPIAIALIGFFGNEVINARQQAIESKKIELEYVKIAKDILTGLKPDTDERITKWAYEMLFKLSPVAVSTQDVRDLSKQNTPLPSVLDRTLDTRPLILRAHEAAFGNLVADAMRTSSKSEVAIINAGAMRGGKIYPAGTLITEHDVLTEFPFSSRVVVLEMSGGDLTEAIENGLSQLPAAAGRFPQVSGLIVEADITRPAGDRVVSIMVGATPLDRAKSYRVATTDFLLRGGDGYDVFRKANLLLRPDDSPLLANVVLDMSGNAARYGQGLRAGWY